MIINKAWVGEISAFVLKDNNAGVCDVGIE